MQASQSALLHGPELFLRWGCHSMSSCDGVGPIVIEPVQIIPKGSPIRHAKTPANPLNTRHHPENWRLVSMFWSSVPCTRSHKSAGLLVLCVVMDQMVGGRGAINDTHTHEVHVFFHFDPKGSAEFWVASRVTRHHSLPACDHSGWQASMG